MSTPVVETDPRAVLPAEASVVTAVRPQDVERFRAALEDDAEPPAQDSSEHDSTAGADGRGGDDAGLDQAKVFQRQVPVLFLPPADAKAVRPVSAARRAVLGTHLERSRAMLPLAELLAMVRERAAGKDVSSLKIVPAEPNPLALTLHLSMNDGEFVVKASTALGPDRREEVSQSLHVLETALSNRLTIPARVVLLA